jgi:large subunit ribosomal protein L15
MSTLASMSNTSRPPSRRKRVGRGTGAGTGKTCGRGTKGQGARSGYKRRYGNEGGQVPLFRKMPTRGFTRGRFKKEVDSVNLGDLEKIFSDGDVVNAVTLRQRGYFSGPLRPLKILGEGELSKKVTINADKYSATAKEKLDKNEIVYSIVE